MGPCRQNTQQEPIFLHCGARGHVFVRNTQLTQLIPARLAGRHLPLDMLNAVLNKETGEIMEYRQLMKSPKYRNLYKNSYSK